MKKITKWILFFVFLLMIMTMVLGAQNFCIETMKKIIITQWEMNEGIIMMLEHNGIKREISELVFRDSRLEIKPDVFKKRGKSISYFSEEFGMFNEDSYQRGRKFIEENKLILSEIEKQKGIPPEFIAALARIETNFGDNRGNSPIINYLYTWFVHKKSSLKRRSDAQREIINLFRIVEKNGWDVFDIPGSYMGCFGLLQFTPTSYLYLAVDGNRDGVVDLFNWDDAIYSAVNHLKANEFGKSLTSRRQALYRYNHSWAYVKAIMEYAKKVKPPHN